MLFPDRWAVDADHEDPPEGPELELDDLPPLEWLEQIASLEDFEPDR
jgi:hypothetical protein